MTHCTGENRMFDTPQRCLGACQGYREESTVACRSTYIAGAAEGVEVEFNCQSAAAEIPDCD
jgi:hypothetical protein